MNDFNIPDASDTSLSPEERARLDAEWVTVSAMREAASIAQKGKRATTYNEAFWLSQELYPSLFNPEDSLLLRQSESDTTREFRQMAEAQSRSKGIDVDPLQLVIDEIEKYGELVNGTSQNDQLRRRLGKLYKAREELTPVRRTENELIFNDVINTEREFPVSSRGRNYTEYQLDKARVLRIRVLHPDIPEQITGADVIYEHYWDKKEVVRLAAIQYKIWENRKLNIDDRAAKQLERLHNTFCVRGHCNQPEHTKRDRAFRLPYCSAFLRPTDRLQHINSQRVSSGYHIPICVVNRLHAGDSGTTRQIESSIFRSEAVTHKVFEEMFNTNMLGSGYLTYDELEQLYKDTKVLESHERVIIHCQEFTFSDN